MKSPAVATTAFTILPIERAQIEARPATLGAYRLHEQLGAGGQARVYRARRMGEPGAGDVALKRLHPHLLPDESAVLAFAREARLAYLLDHPVIRRVQALCRETDELYMIMEYVDGVSLDAVLKRASATRHRLPLPGILTALHRLCGALHYAHELVDERGAPAGLVHRDVSPSNVIVAATGALKLIDMGVARSQSAEHVTNSGLIKGKYGYMAPEVMWGRPFDRRADVFSVGVVAWELLTASKLFPVRNPPVDLEQVRARVIEPPSRRNARCPLELDAIVLRALATDPAERWATCAELAEALQQLAVRLGEPLADRTLAGLAEVLAVHDSVRVPARPTPRSRFARGTPAEVPTSPTTPPHATHPPATPPARCRRCRRSFALGAAGGAAASMVVALIASYLLARPTPPGLDPPPPAAPTMAPAVATIAALVADAGVAVDAASADAAAAAMDAGGAAAGGGPDAGSVDAVALDGHELIVVPAAAVTRLDGPVPRSRSTTAPYRAKLCIDATGAVFSVAVLDGPAHLEERIARTLLRGRYAPYRDAAGVRPVCFEVAARLQKIPRGT